MKLIKKPLATFALAGILAACSGNQLHTLPVLMADEPEPNSPCSAQECQIYWGDVHVHSNMSFDAYLQGTHSLSPVEAYRFARGEPVTADNGMQAQLARPLDFLGVADHAENMGLFTLIDNQDSRIAGTELYERWRTMPEKVAAKGLRTAFIDDIQAIGPFPEMSDELNLSVWTDVARMADEFNDPGTFTTLIGYEWTSQVTGDNLHRVILYRDGAEQASVVAPYTTAQSNDPEDLWKALAAYEELGGRALAIPHNGNLSNGRMFAPIRLDGTAIDADYARRRARWEPLFEVTQIKGDSETHPVLSPTDEFADFETWDESNVSGTTPKTDEMLPFEYARSGLKQGLLHEHETGENPFQFGMIGSTDSHTGLSTTDEDNYWGKFLNSEPGPDRASALVAGDMQPNWQLGASGLTAVWAPQNTRADMFDALARREVYGTTGTRIRLRFFGGWDYSAQDDASLPQAYTNGVPMGGELHGIDLSRTGHEGAPSFLINAARDPAGANLQRVQMVKGWLDHHGELQEEVFDIALAANPETGAAELSTWWQDPHFHSDELAFYYVRVLEIPTRRWTSFDEERYAVDYPDEAPLSQQERAYSSPIWYRP